MLEDLETSMVTYQNCYCLLNINTTVQQYQHYVGTVLQVGENVNQLTARAVSRSF